MVLLFLVSLAVPSEAQTYRTVREVGETRVRVENTWLPREGDAPRRARVVLEGGGPAVTAHEGPAVLHDVAVSGARVLVALTGREHVAFHVFEVARGRVTRVGSSRVEKVQVPDSIPGAIVTSPAHDGTGGFLAIWQDVGSSRSARSWWVRVGPDAATAGPPTEIPVGWALAALSSTPTRHHLALYYDGGAPGQTTLCGVTLDSRGQPEQHPWFVSAPGLVDDVQLVRVGDRVRAYHRGGPDGAALFSVDVTTEGAWGTPPGSIVREMAIDRAADYVVRVGGTAARVVVVAPPGGR